MQQVIRHQPLGKFSLQRIHLLHKCLAIR
jgi:hypothetical protein